MDIYKLSCPRCGQRIEYTRDYCGKRVQCPSCSGDVVFPAIPPGAHQPLRLERDRPKVKARFNFDLAKILGSIATFFRTFKHWQIVAMCLLPFILIVVGLAAASLVRKSDAEPKPKSSALSASEIAESQRIEALNQIEAIVRDRVHSVWTAKTAVDNARRNSAALHSVYDGKQLSDATRRAVDARYKVADEEIETAEAAMNGWKNAFETEYGKYQKLGGKTDYRSQLPR